MLYTIKLVSTNKLCKFKADKKGKISSVEGIPQKELEKFLSDFNVGIPVEVHFRINEWGNGKKTLVIEEIYNRKDKRYASPMLMETLFDLVVDWLKPVKMCNSFEGSLDEAKQVAERLNNSQLKLVQKNQLKRKRHVFYLPITDEQPTMRMAMAQKEHYEKEMK
jgi:hypothetical protein